MIINTKIYVAISYIYITSLLFIYTQVAENHFIEFKNKKDSTLNNNNIDDILIQDGYPYVLEGAIVVLKKYGFEIELGKEGRQNALVRHDREKVIS